MYSTAPGRLPVVDRLTREDETGQSEGESMSRFGWMALVACVGQVAFGVLFFLYVGLESDRDTHALCATLAILGLLGIAAHCWPVLRWIPAVLNGGFALAALVPLAMVVPEWLGPGGNTMMIFRYGRNEAFAPQLAVLCVAVIWLLSAVAAVGFAMMGRRPSPRGG